MEFRIFRRCPVAARCLPPVPPCWPAGLGAGGGACLAAAGGAAGRPAGAADAVHHARRHGRQPRPVGAGGAAAGAADAVLDVLCPRRHRRGRRRGRPRARDHAAHADGAARPHRSRPRRAAHLADAGGQPCPPARRPRPAAARGRAQPARGQRRLAVGAADGPGDGRAEGARTVLHRQPDDPEQRRAGACQRARRAGHRARRVPRQRAEPGRHPGPAHRRGRGAPATRSRSAIRARRPWTCWSATCRSWSSAASSCGPVSATLAVQRSRQMVVALVLQPRRASLCRERR